MAVNRLNGYIELGNCPEEKTWTFFTSQNVGSAILVILDRLSKLTEAFLNKTLNGTNE